MQTQRPLDGTIDSVGQGKAVHFRCSNVSVTGKGDIRNKYHFPMFAAIGRYRDADRGAQERAFRTQSF
jgi:hypothetical protein